jgi:hypothetical protein
MEVAELDLLRVTEWRGERQKDQGYNLEGWGGKGRRKKLRGIFCYSSHQRRRGLSQHRLLLVEFPGVGFDAEHLGQPVCGLMRSCRRMASLGSVKERLTHSPSLQKVGCARAESAHPDGVRLLKCHILYRAGIALSRGAVPGWCSVKISFG